MLSTWAEIKWYKSRENIYGSFEIPIASVKSNIDTNSFRNLVYLTCLLCAIVGLIIFLRLNLIKVKKNRAIGWCWILFVFSEMRANSYASLVIWQRIDFISSFRLFAHLYWIGSNQHLGHLASVFFPIYKKRSNFSHFVLFNILGIGENKVPIFFIRPRVGDPSMNLPFKKKNSKPENDQIAVNQCNL